MDRIEFVRLLEPLVKAMGQEFDKPMWTVYYRALQDVPVRLLAAAVERAAKSCRFMPKPGELRVFADEARTALLSSIAFLPCASCSSQGWTEREIDGVKRMVRCGCWTRHQERVQALDVGEHRLALPAAVGEDA